MSLPYFREFGWNPEILTVDIRCSDMAIDPLLTESVPPDVPVHYVKALSKKWTGKIGLGSIALRSLPYLDRKGNQLLKDKAFDLVYFSTTQYPVCVLGRFWKKRFGIPYVIDVQDPWRSDYYLGKPKNERPPKFWFSYRLDKFLEPLAMNRVDGLLAVSHGYLETLADRYPNCAKVPQQTIPFGAFDKDFEIAKKHLVHQPSVLEKKEGRVNVVYIGRGGRDMQGAVSLLFRSFRECLAKEPALYGRLHFHFIGTSYASAGKGTATVLPLADAFGISSYVTEITDRLPFYQTLNTLADADALFVPGSNDPQYTASKIYPYVLAQKPLLAIFHPLSSVVDFLRLSKAGTVLCFDQDESTIHHAVANFLYNVVSHTAGTPRLDLTVIEQYSAREMTKRQCALFDEVGQFIKNFADARVSVSLSSPS